MNTLTSCKAGVIGILDAVLMVIIFMRSPRAFAMTYTDVNNTHESITVWGWIVAMIIAGLLSGVGFFTTIRRRKLGRD